MIYQSSRQLALSLYAVLSITYIDGSLTSNMTRLVSDLLEEYNVDNRPMPGNLHKATVVDVELIPIHVTYLDEKKSILTLETVVNMAWHDERLTWSPKDYAGIEDVRIDQMRLWKPDVAAHERRGPTDFNWFPVQLMVRSTGTVTWMSTATLELICGGMDYRNFPLDSHLCVITLSSWTYNKNSMDFRIENDHYSYYETGVPKNPTWRITSTSVTRTETNYPDLGGVPFVEVKFTLELERHNSPVSFLSYYPSSIARLLILCMFWTPDATRKFILACTSFLVLTIVGSTVLLEVPSPAAANVALWNVKSGMMICAAAVLVEMILIAISECRSKPPSCLDSFADSMFCRVLCPCCRPSDGSGAPDRTKEDNKQDTNTRTGWKFLARILTFVAFLVFLLLVTFL